MRDLQGVRLVDAHDVVRAAGHGFLTTRRRSTPRARRNWNVFGDL